MASYLIGLYKENKQAGQKVCLQSRGVHMTWQGSTVQYFFLEILCLFENNRLEPSSTTA